MRTRDVLLLSTFLATLALLQAQGVSRRGSRRLSGTSRASSDQSTIDRFCRALKERRSLRRLSQEDCLDELEKWCKKRLERGRTSREHSRCRALRSFRSDWDRDVRPRERSRGSRRGGRRGGRGGRTGGETDPTDPINTWSSNRQFRGKWKEVRAKKAPQAKIKEAQDVMARLAQRDSQQADRMFGAIDQRTVRKKNPKAKKAVTELEINNPKEHLFGDNLATPEQVEDLLEDLKASAGTRGKKRRKRKVATGIYSLWPRGKAISYHFNGNVVAPTRDLIRRAIKLWQDNTCIRFRENGPDTNRIEFTNGGGCSSYVGMVGGTQEISIRTPGCNYIGIVSHEIGHALGFFHEQARPDRDQAVSINMRNVNFWYQNNFAKVATEDVAREAAALDYDYGSVMHYGPYSFATRKDVPTIVPRKGKEGYQDTMGQRKRPSFIDFLQVNRVYCRDSCSGGNPCEHGGYRHPNDCSRCVCPTGFGGVRCDIAEPTTSCPGSGLLTAYRQRQSLSTPGWPNRFPAGTECVWVIRTRPGYRVFYSVDDDFELDCKETCDENYLEIKYAADFRRTGPRYCCDSVPFDGTQESESHELVLMMRNLERVRRNGFKITYWTDANVNKPGGGNATPQPTTTTTTRRPRRTTTVIPGETSTWTLPSSTTGPAGLPTTEPPTPPPGAPDSEAKCVLACSAWEPWSAACSQECGGCGSRRRSRTCPAFASDCQLEQKLRCNREPCPAETRWLSANQEFHLLLDGCCVGQFKTGGQCGGLNDQLAGLLSSIGLGGDGATPAPSGGGLAALIGRFVG